MIYWALLLHFYQPPTQRPDVLRKVCDESYLPLIELLREYPHARATVNINGVLTEMLWDCGHNDIIVGLKELASRGQVEFTGSAKYHAILPLIPPREMERQIRQNRLTNLHFFGDVYQPRGFFPPELAYSRDILEAVARSGHEWIVLSGGACTVPWPRNIIHQVSTSLGPLSVFFRDDILSNKVSFHSVDGMGFLENLRQLKAPQGDTYMVMATDAETFGHHIKNWERLFLGKVYEAIKPLQPPSDTADPAHYENPGPMAPAEEDTIRSVTVSQLLGLIPAGSLIEPRASSWSTTPEDFSSGNYFPLWKDARNPVHRLQWEHMDIALDLVSKAEEAADNDESRHLATVARSLLDPALHSCQFWWASKRPMWDIDMVNRGLFLQQQAIFSAYKAVKACGCPQVVKRDCYYTVLAARELSNRIQDILIEG